MQAQRARTGVQAISSTQSLTAVQTLLKAGLGCITFLRNLLPEDNFTESHFTTTDDSLPCGSSVASFSTAEATGRRRVSGFKIMTMTRGYTDEADRILNYLEYGIFDALEKQYLRSFIFAIYLDSKDPNNIVEAYTFDFQYHTLPGTNIVVPVMSLGGDMRNMPLSDTRGISIDPLAEAFKKGKVPTLKDVKKSVKALLKTLIHVMSQMDNLPRRRYATFKVFYTDKAPADYEPPHFQAGDTKKDKWFFMTHDLDEIPDKWSIGKLNTGHHSVNLTVASIVGYLPSTTEHDHAPFIGITSNPFARLALTPGQEAVIRAQQAEEQNRDAESRNIVWSAEEDLELRDADAEGEDDPEYVRQPDGRYEKVKNPDMTACFSVPIGIRNGNGEIEILPAAARGGEAFFGGESEDIPTRLKEINLESVLDRSAVEETQSLTTVTQEMSLSSLSPSRSPSNPCDEISSATLGLASLDELPSSDPTSLLYPMTNVSISGPEPAAEISKSNAVVRIVEVDDCKMLGVETQRDLDMDSQNVESIQSFGPEQEVDSIDESSETPAGSSVKKITESVIVDNGLQCDCGVSIEDASCFCEGGCGRWFHLWCMGYHTVKDARIPSKFICFDCRVRADLSWELLKVDLYPKMIAKFKELALFRRAIKVAEREKTGKLADFAKSFGGDNALTRQLMKRLENEGFVVEQITTLDELGFTTTTSTRSRNKGKTKAKQPRPRKSVQKPQYAFNQLMKTSTRYSKYFDPTPKVENQMLGLSDLKNNLKSRKNPAPAPPTFTTLPIPQSAISPETIYNETQTQDEETQALIVSREGGLKRTGTVLEVDPVTRPKKKVKISITAGVDLAE